MSSATIDQWLSEARFAPFLKAAHFERAQAIDLYRWHTRLSSSSFEAVCHVEVILRNAIDREMSALDRGGGLGEWWVSDGRIQTRLAKAQVQSVLGRHRSLGARITKDRLISSLPFSFWVHLFGRSESNEQLWRKHLHRALPAAPSRKEVLIRLESIRKLRNRIAHHDSLLNIDLKEKHSEILEVTGWIDPDAAEWVSGESKVIEVLDRCPV